VKGELKSDPAPLHLNDCGIGEMALCLALMQTADGADDADEWRLIRAGSGKEEPQINTDGHRYATSLGENVFNLAMS
jgi:hypothetical protein